MDPSTWTVTGVLLTINVLAFLAEVSTGVSLTGNSYGGTIFYHGVLFGPLMTGGHHEYWRLVTAGFLHASIWHIGFNMLFLWFVGRDLEPAIGKTYFTAIYFTSLLAGSFGAILFEPDVPTLGASGALFGIFGALIVVAHSRHIPLWRSGLIPVLILNFVFTLTIANVSLGAHLLGLIAGLATGWLVVEYGERRDQRALVLIGCLAISVAAVFAAIGLAGGTGLTPNGLTL